MSLAEHARPFHRSGNPGSGGDARAQIRRPAAARPGPSRKPRPRPGLEARRGSGGGSRRRPVGVRLIGAFVSPGRWPRRPGLPPLHGDLLKITSSSTSSPHLMLKGREGARNRSREQPPTPHTGFEGPPGLPQAPPASSRAPGRDVSHKPSSALPSPSGQLSLRRRRWCPGGGGWDRAPACDLANRSTPGPGAGNTVASSALPQGGRGRLPSLDAGFLKGERLGLRPVHSAAWTAGKPPPQGGKGRSSRLWGPAE